jgi:rubrerythrin
VIAALAARMPSTLDELFRMLGETCAVCGETTVREEDAWACASCGSVLEDVRPEARPRLRLVP